MKKTFENQWQEVLSNTDISAPEGSWAWIEAELEKKKRKPVFILWNSNNILKLAAACLVLLGIGTYVFLPNAKTEKISKNTVSQPKNEYKKQIEKVNASEIPIKTTHTQMDKVRNPIENIASFSEIRKTNNTAKENNFARISKIKNTQNQSNINESNGISEIVNSDITEVVAVNNISEITPSNTLEKIEFEKIELAYLQAFTLDHINVKTIQDRSFLSVDEIEPVAKVKSEKSKRWIGIQSGSSPFSPAYNSQTVASTYAAQVDNTAAFNIKTAGSPTADANNSNLPYEQFSGGGSRSFGLEMGKKIRKRWTVGAMLRFSNAHINQKTNVFAINQKTGSVNSYFQSNYLLTADKKDQVFTSVPSESTQSFRYIQVPVYVSYQLPIFSKLDLEFQTGISNDIFLSSKLKGDIVDEVNFTSKNSKYKILNFSGLAGLGLNLKITKNWRAVVQGNFQKALFSGTKGDLDFRPRFMGVNYGFRYEIL
jgi:Outer membrane protein beta-barrel domain